MGMGVGNDAKVAAEVIIRRVERDCERNSRTGDVPERRAKERKEATMAIWALNSTA